MKVLYVRVSSETQNTERQKINEKHFDYTIEDKLSGSIPFFERPGGIRVKQLIELGHLTQLNVWSIDRLGRNLKNILETIEFFDQKKIPIKFINQGVQTLNQDGTKSHIGTLLINILGSLAQLTRSQILESQRAGIELAKARGVYKGRANGTKEDTLTFLSKPKNKKAIDLLKKGYKNIEVSRIVGLHPNTITKVKRKMQLNQN